MKSTEKEQINLSELEKLSVKQLLELAASCGIFYDPRVIHTIKEFELIDVLQNESDPVKLKAELEKMKA
jgi:hypothetical protein